MRQLAREPAASPSMLEGLLRRLRELATGESSNGSLRETLEDLLEEEEAAPIQRYCALPRPVADSSVQ